MISSGTPAVRELLGSSTYDTGNGEIAGAIVETVDAGMRWQDTCHRLPTCSGERNSHRVGESGRWPPQQALQVPSVHEQLAVADPAIAVSQELGYRRRESS